MGVFEELGVIVHVPCHVLVKVCEATTGEPKNVGVSVGVGEITGVSVIVNEPAPTANVIVQVGVRVGVGVEIAEKVRVEVREYTPYGNVTVVVCV